MQQLGVCGMKTRAGMRGHQETGDMGKDTSWGGSVEKINVEKDLYYYQTFESID